MRPWMQAAMTYFYPRSPCGERHGAELDIHHNFPISIHALLAESDSAGQAEKPGNRDFYPRSPCGERPSARSLVASLSRQFLSTLSLRRATAGQFCPGRTFQISIHALLAESDRHCADTLWFRRHISIHALLAESDQAVPAATPRAGHFYPRSPCGERRAKMTGTMPNNGISIHALLAESDLFWLRLGTRVSDFYPRSPCGERLHYDNYNLHCVEISIHALLAESDSRPRRLKSRRCVFLSTLSLRRATWDNVKCCCSIRDFYPRSPCGERPRDSRSVPRWHAISIHALLAESDLRGCPVWSRRRYFYPRSPCGERRDNVKCCCSIRDFYPRSPCGERRAPSPPGREF